MIPLPGMTGHYRPTPAERVIPGERGGAARAAPIEGQWVPPKFTRTIAYHSVGALIYPCATPAP